MSPVPGARVVPWLRPVTALLALAAAVALAMVALGHLAPAPVGATAPNLLEAPAIRYARSTLDLVGQYSVNLDPTQWQAQRRRVLVDLAGATTIPETYDALDAAIRSATRGQGHLAGPQAGPSPAPPPRRASVTVADGIGHVVLPAAGALTSEAVNRRATRLATAIGEGRSAATCGWVVDLRGTGTDGDLGGVAGLAAFLPDGTLYSLVDRQSTVAVTFAAGTVFLAGQPQASADSQVLPISQPVAVLQDGRTNRSGEALVAALRRNPRVTTFGETTAGRAASSTFTLGDGATLTLPTVQLADVRGLVRDGGLAPDRPTRSADAPTAATRWLRDACAR